MREAARPLRGQSRRYNGYDIFQNALENNLAHPPPIHSPGA
jgi:hypothetical protein